jgi:class 3 adenylate cyclase
MTDPNVLRKIFEQEELEYALFDQSTHLVAKSKALSHHLMFPMSDDAGSRTITDLFPELVGYETQLDDIVKGNAKHLTLERIHRTDMGGQPGYVTITVIEHNALWLVVTRDVTYEGVLEQRVTQQRNDLELLKEKLERANKRLDQLFRKFVASPVVDSMLEDGQFTRLGGERRIVTVMFADIRGFTTWAEPLSPEEIITSLNATHKQAFEILMDAEGTLTQVMGDGIMAIFNAPLDQDDHALRAVKCAEQIAKLNPLGTLRFGVGLNSGPVVVGNVGTEQIMEFSAIGTTTNIAARFEKMAPPGGVYFGKSTYAMLEGQIPAVLEGEFELKGIQERALVYRLVGEENNG